MTSCFLILFYFWTSVRRASSNYHNHVNWRQWKQWKSLSKDGPVHNTHKHTSVMFLFSTVCVLFVREGLLTTIASQFISIYTNFIKRAVEGGKPILRENHITIIVINGQRSAASWIVCLSRCVLTIKRNSFNSTWFNLIRLDLRARTCSYTRTCAWRWKDKRTQFHSIYS